MKHHRIAAIFDVDGTLSKGRTLERTFLRFLARTGEISARELGNWIGGVTRGLPLRENKYHFRGWSHSKLASLARICFESEIRPRLLDRAIARVRLHQISGHDVALLSGTLQVLLDPLAEMLEVQAARGTILESSAGLLTGRIVGAHPYYAGKVCALDEMKRTFDFDLTRSFGYGNHHTDRLFLAAVRHPVAVNPDPRLRVIAESRGWIVEDFAVASGDAAAGRSRRECVDQKLIDCR